MVGNWDVKVSTGGMPEKIATAVGDLKIVGAEYTPIAYLGSQVVNGINHAVLAEQLVVAGKDTKNVVVIMFNERPEGVTLVGIERVLESGGELGGISVDVKTDIPQDAKDAFDAVMNGFVGSKIEPFALLGTQITKGTNYIFAATLTPVTQDPKQSAVLVIANSLTGELSISDMLGTRHDAMALGYAFTWLKRQNTSLGAPLGEWP
jgi:hypothetical protein